MARIGIDARLYGTESGTGIGRYVEELIRALSARERASDAEEWEFVVFLRKDGYATFEPPNDRWSKVLADFRPYTLGVQTRFPKIIRAANVDLMHFTHFDHPIRCPVPFVTTIHDLILLHHPSIRASTLGPIRFWSKYLAYRAVLRHAVRRSRRICTPSETIRAQLHEELRVPLERIAATQLGVDHVTRKLGTGSWELGSSAGHQSPTPNSKLPTPSFLLYIGNAYPHKRLEVLITFVDMFRKHWPENPLASRCSLVIVGREDDFSRRIRANTAAHPWITWYGPASEQERTQLVRSAAAYVTFSADEGFDLPAVEALALGTPVIASDIPVHREILGDAALSGDGTNTRALSEAILDLMIHTGPTSHRATLSTKGRARAQRYVWRTCAQRTLRVYRDALPCLDVEPPRRRDGRDVAPPTSSPPHSSSPTSTRG